MKKVLLILPVMILTLLMSSCKGDEGPMGPPGVGYYFADHRDVKASDWVAFGYTGEDGAYFEYSLPVPALDAIVYDYGVVNTYVEFGNEKFMLNKTLPQYDSAGNLEYFIYYDFSYNEGWIHFRVSYSDNVMRNPGLQRFWYVLQSLDY